MEKYPHFFESKILEITCLLLAFTSFIGSISNYLLNLEFELTIITVVLFFLGILNWWMLVKYKHFNFVRLSISIILILVVNIIWYFNYSSHGPTLGFFILLVFLFIFIWPLKNLLYILFFIVLDVIALLYIEINYKNFILNYPTDHDRIIDTYVTAFFIMAAAFVFGSFAKSNYLKKYEEAKKSGESKTRFLQNMSHELRTPLNAIIGFSDIIDAKLTKDEMIAYAKIINISGNHLLNLVDDVFNITHIESGELKISKENVELHPLLKGIQEIIKSEQKKTNKGNIELVLKIQDENLGIILNTDPARLRQILINLLKNALKFTDKGHIYFGYKIDKDQGKSMLKFFVEDTGIGISSGNSEIIFNLFVQIDDLHKRANTGAGLGLAISKKLTELLGGNIWVDSKEGKGSTFYFTLPYKNGMDSEI